MLEYRNAGRDDAALVADLICRSFADQIEILGIDEKKAPRFAAFDTPERVIERMDEGGTVVVAYLNGEPIGTVTYNRDFHEEGKGFILRLCVLPEYRGRKFGDMLLRHAEDEIKKLGFGAARLAMIAEFPRLQRFYESRGYVIIERKRFPDVPFDLLFMEKRFGD